MYARDAVAKLRDKDTTGDDTEVYGNEYLSDEKL
jgi:hypothetical protein